jgi:cytochrome oxidase assembly protein ShyY1
MYRFLVSRHWLGIFGAVVVFAVACGLLADWQWHRLEGRHAANHLISANLHAPATPAATALSVGHDPAKDREWLPVRATGHWDLSHQLLVRLRDYDGSVGFYVLTPLVTQAGPAVLVNRGWVSAGAGGTNVPRVPAPPDGTVTVTGRLRPTEPPATGAAPPRGQVTRIDVPGIARTLPYDVYGGFLELTAQVPKSAKAPHVIPAPEPSEGPHLLYAVQWVLFALMGFGGFIVLARREAADRRAGREAPVPTTRGRYEGVRRAR